MNEREIVRLSEQGAARREAMLGALLGEMREVHSRRRLRRRAATYAALGVAAALLVMVVMPRTQPAPVRDVAVGTPEDATDVAGPFGADAAREAAGAPRAVVKAQIVHTDPNIAERYIVRTTSHRALLLTDEELIDTLEAIGRPTGLVRTNGRVWLTAAVTDEEKRNEL